MPSLKLLYGPMLIGVFLNCILYGVLIMQAFVYYQSCKKDQKWIRFLILYLVVAETANTICDMHMMFEPLVLEYATPRASTYFPTMLAADPIITVSISMPIQIFIAWRIKVVSGWRVVPAAIVFTSVVGFASAIWLGVKVTQVQVFAKKPELHPPAMLWLWSTAAADVAITAALCYSLSKRKTGFGQTDDAINSIIRLTVQTGMITAIFAVLDAVLSLTDAHTGLNWTWDFALSKLYSNSLLSTLNARARWIPGATSQTMHMDNVLFSTEIMSSGFVTTLSNTSGAKKVNLSTARSQTSGGMYELSSSGTTGSIAKEGDDFDVVPFHQRDHDIESR